MNIVLKRWRRSAKVLVLAEDLGEEVTTLAVVQNNTYRIFIPDGTTEGNDTGMSGDEPAETAPTQAQPAPTGRSRRGHGRGIPQHKRWGMGDQVPKAR